MADRYNFHPAVAPTDPIMQRIADALDGITVTAIDEENGTITVDTMSNLDRFRRAAMADYMFRRAEWSRGHLGPWSRNRSPKREARRIRMARKKRRGFA